MREIKFRCYDKKLNKIAMFTGQPRIETNSPVTNLVFTLEDWNPGGENVGYYDINYSHDLDGDIGDNLYLMQYTGLKDKNGKPIYEGDVIRHSQGVDEVHWLYDQWRVGGWEPDGLYGFTSNCEIIGDIYSNPELLTHKQ